MILTCPKCQAQYKLDSAVLGAAGRDVRCVSCSHTWFQIPETAVPAAAEAKPAQLDMSSAQSITDALQSILEKDGAAFDEVLSTVAKSEQKKKT
ncbi:MAG: zinc-ribbon domain-containing protein, partial [Alphaproteobacteria bacterium]|nr:zinc-ribbon domain-containing protein [Alphaproteobacteria bacterium]